MFSHKGTKAQRDEKHPHSNKTTLARSTRAGSTRQVLTGMLIHALHAGFRFVLDYRGCRPGP